MTVSFPDVRHEIIRSRLDPMKIETDGPTFSPLLDCLSLISVSHGRLLRKPSLTGGNETYGRKRTTLHTVGPGRKGR